MASKWSTAGGVDRDESIDSGVERIGTALFHEVVAEAEAILLDADATHAGVECAKDIADAVNAHDEKSE